MVLAELYQRYGKLWRAQSSETQRIKGVQLNSAVVALLKNIRREKLFWKEVPNGITD